jgi:hypothetical protein
MLLELPDPGHRSRRDYLRYLVAVGGAVAS